MVISDIAPINITSAEKLARFAGFGTDYFVLCDAEKLPFLPSSFDFLFSSAMLHHLGDLRRALRCGHTVLRPGGRWYVINELSIGTLPRLFWNSRWGAKGKWARQMKIHENSYTLPEWINFFENQNFTSEEMYFHRDPSHKLRDWTLSAYYALASRLPIPILKMGISCEVCFVLQRN